MSAFTWTCDLDDKMFSVLVNSVIKQIYYDDKAITDQLLYEELFTQSQLSDGKATRGTQKA